MSKPKAVIKSLMVTFICNELIQVDSFFMIRLWTKVHNLPRLSTNPDLKVGVNEQKQAVGFSPETTSNLR
jgi:hypothetical protein